MKIEKLCEYLSDMGLIKLDNINNFLKIYSQISKNKYKTESDKIMLALFSYFALISKNDQNLYDICKSIIDCYLTNQILNRYKGIKYLNNIFRSKLHSRYNLFLIKLILSTNKKQNKFNHQKYYNNFDNNFKIENFKNNTQLNFYNNTNNINRFNNNNYLPTSNSNEIKKGKIVSKNRNLNFNDINDIIDKVSSDKENVYFTLSPKNNKSAEFNQNNNNNNSRNIRLNYNYYNYKYPPERNYSYNMNENIEDKNLPFKSNMNYGYNDNINKEIEKLYNYYHYNNSMPNDIYSPNYPVKKKSKNKQNNNYYYRKRYKSPNYINMIYNNYSPYYENNNDYYYNFYEKEQEHLRKVEDKILQLKIQQFNEISEKCTFNPKVNEYRKYASNSPNKTINRNRPLNNCLTSLNISDRKMLNINDSPNKKIIKMKEKRKNDFNKGNNTNNLIAKKNKIKSKSRSFSAPKLKSKEKDKENLKEEENKGKKINKSKPKHDEEAMNRLYNINNKNKKDGEKEKEIKDNKVKKKSIVHVKDVINRLYKPKNKSKSKEGEKEKEKSKKKIIDWDKNRKDYNKKYPNDFGKAKKKNLKPKVNKNDKKEQVIDFKDFGKKK